MLSNNACVGQKLGKNLEMHQNQCISKFHLVFCPLSAPHHVFFIAPFVFNKHRVLTPIFFNVIENFIVTKS
jgi:hypothetical protein